MGPLDDGRRGWWRLGLVLIQASRSLLLQQNRCTRLSVESLFFYSNSPVIDENKKFY
jgi:hypothetical protein